MAVTDISLAPVSQSRQLLYVTTPLLLVPELLILLPFTSTFMLKELSLTFFVTGGLYSKCKIIAVYSADFRKTRLYHGSLDSSSSPPVFSPLPSSPYHRRLCPEKGCRRRSFPDCRCPRLYHLFPTEKSPVPDLLSADRPVPGFSVLHVLFFFKILLFLFMIERIVLACHQYLRTALIYSGYGVPCAYP